MEIKNENEKRENEIKIVNGTWSYIYEIWHAFGIPLIVDTVPTLYNVSNIRISCLNHYIMHATILIS